MTDFLQPISVSHYLVVGALLFVTGAVCMATKRNALGVLMGVELDGKKCARKEKYAKTKSTRQEKKIVD